MKTKFVQPLTRRVRLVHGGKEAEEVVELDVAPLPAGFIAFVQTVIPDPIEYLNGVPRGVDQARMPRATWHRNLCLVARALGGQVDASAPVSSDPPAWTAYAERLEVELRDAGLTEGDVDQLIKEINRVNHGAGTVGNGSGGGAGA